MAVTKWSNVTIAMQSAISAITAVTAITKANPAVVSSTAHGLADGDYMIISAQGMSQVNGRVFRVSASSTDSFELEGIDSSEFDTFTSGSVSGLTLGINMNTVTSVSSSGGDFDFIDTTTIHDAIKTQIPGLPSALSYTFENKWDISDPALSAMKLASDNQAERAFLFTFPNGQKMAFNGFVGASLVPGGSAQDKVVTSTTITAFGSPTYYVS